MEISLIGIIGAGTMGTKIACRCIVSGLQVMIYDKYPEILEHAEKQIKVWLDERIHHNNLNADHTREAIGRLHSCSTLRDCVGVADLVIETVPENLDLKRLVLKEINCILPKKAFICTNSSSLTCSRMANSLSRPERFFNINFSQPQDTTDKLVELMRGEKTGDEAMIVGEKFVRLLDMVPIITYREIMGFSFNRIWRAVKREALHLVDQGYSDYQDIDRAWMMEFGTPFGPFGLMDIIGLDVVRDIEEQYYLESGNERDRSPKLLNNMIIQGKLGVKSGQGFYSYPDPAYKQQAWLLKHGHYHEEIKTKMSQRKQ